MLVAKPSAENDPCVGQDRSRDLIQAVGRAHVRIQRRTAAVAHASESGTPQAVSVGRIVAAVAAHYGVAPAAFDTGRRRALTEARQVAYYLARKLSSRTFAEIGRRIGGRDHCTVLYGCRKIAARLARGDERLLREIEAIEAGLRR
jgi:chromosomal replication initiator protein